MSPRVTTLIHLSKGFRLHSPVPASGTGITLIGRSICSVLSLTSSGYLSGDRFVGRPGGPKRICAGDRDATAIGLLQEFSLTGLEPPWVRLPPPRLPTQDEEVYVSSVSHKALMQSFPGVVYSAQPSSQGLP